MTPDELNEKLRTTLSGLLGMRIIEAGPDRVVAELEIRDDLRTVGGALHGGTLMALADTVGAAATVVNLPAGGSTATIESKTNFFAAVRSGTVEARSRPLHRGSRTIVVETDLFDESRKHVARVTQTQAVL